MGAHNSFIATTEDGETMHGIESDCCFVNKGYRGEGLCGGRVSDPARLITTCHNDRVV